MRIYPLTLTLIAVLVSSLDLELFSQFNYQGTINAAGVSPSGYVTTINSTWWIQVYRWDNSTTYDLVSQLQQLSFQRYRSFKIEMSQDGSKFLVTGRQYYYNYTRFYFSQDGEYTFRSHNSSDFLLIDKDFQFYFVTQLAYYYNIHCNRLNVSNEYSYYFTLYLGADARLKYLTASKNLKYLGIYISRIISDTETKNYSTIYSNQDPSSPTSYNIVYDLEAEERIQFLFEKILDGELYIITSNNRILLNLESGLFSSQHLIENCLIQTAIQAANGYLYVACSDNIYIYDQSNFQKIGNLSLQKTPITIGYNSQEDKLTIVYQDAIKTYEIIGCLQYGDTCLLCTDGLYPDPNSFECLPCASIQNCLECLSTSIQCLKCEHGFYPDSQTQGCLTCDSIENCIICHAAFQWCLECQDGFYANILTGQCESCGLIKNCDTCSKNSRYCLECDTGYTPNFTGECETCASVDENCETCSTFQQRCLKCSSGFHLIIQTGKCESCLSNKCKFCFEASQICLECFSGYYPDSTGNCLSCSVMSNCQICSTIQEQCLQCRTGYYPDIETGRCKSCAFYQCKSCQSASKCLQCETGFYLDTLSGGCLSCDLFKNCLTCSTTSSQCLQCKQGFYPDSQTSECLNCSTLNNCVSCLSTSQRCLSCKIDFYPDIQTGQCQSCSSNKCKTCSSASQQCFECESGYFPDPETGECLSCQAIIRCKVCSTTSQQCLQCQLGYYPGPLALDCLSCDSLDKCVACQTTSRRCLQCEDGFFPNSETGDCESGSPTIYIMAGSLGAVIILAVLLGTIDYLKIKRKGCFAQKNDQHQKKRKKKVTPGEQEKDKKRTPAGKKKKPNLKKNQLIESNQVLYKVHNEL